MEDYFISSAVVGASAVAASSSSAMAMAMGCFGGDLPEQMADIFAGDG